MNKRDKKILCEVKIPKEEGYELTLSFHISKEELEGDWNEIKKRVLSFLDS